MKHDAQPGDQVELKDKDSGFSDPETNFDISRDQQKQLGDSIGRLTGQALSSGALLVVSGKTSKKDSSKNSSNFESDLPEDFPGRDAFVAAKMNLEQVKTFDFEKGKVEGVGAATIKAVGEYFK